MKEKPSRYCKTTLRKGESRLPVATSKESGNTNAEQDWLLGAGPKPAAKDPETRLK